MTVFVVLIGINFERCGLNGTARTDGPGFRLLLRQNSAYAQFAEL